MNWQTWLPNTTGFWRGFCCHLQTPRHQISFGRLQPTYLIDNPPRKNNSPHQEKFLHQNKLMGYHDIVLFLASIWGVVTFLSQHVLSKSCCYPVDKFYHISASTSSTWTPKKNSEACSFPIMNPSLPW